MANAGKITVGVGFNVDKTGLTDIKKSLAEIQKMKIEDVFKIDDNTTSESLQKMETKLDNAKLAAQQLEMALSKSFNQKIDTVNFDSFIRELDKANTSIAEIEKSLTSMGAVGENAFRKLVSEQTKVTQHFQKSKTILDKMGETLANTVKWNLASGAVNKMTGALQEAYGYVQHLDSSLNDIRIVTGQSAEEMAVFAEQANTAASALGRTTTDYTEASLIFAQQGLVGDELTARTEATLKAANVTGQTAAAVSEQLTAVWNGFKVGAEDTEQAVDILAAVAASTASDLEELSTGMSKVASAANLMGVNEEQLAAQLSTIISVTRQAPENVGTALKTVYSRISDIKAGIDEDGVTLGTYSGKLADLGINVLDANNELRDMGDVIEEVGTKWGSFTREQQVNVAQVMGGARQYSMLLSLFDNWDQYTAALEIANDATGTLQEQQDTYMESTQAHLNQLTAAWEDLYDSILDTDAINTIADAFTNIVGSVGSFVDSLGGGVPALTTIASLLGNIFKGQISNGMTRFLMNLQQSRNEAGEIAEKIKTIQAYQSALNDAQTKEVVDDNALAFDLRDILTEEELNGFNQRIGQLGALFDKLNLLKQEQEQQQTAIPIILKTFFQEEDFNSMDEEYLAQKLEDELEEVSKIFDKYESELGEKASQISGSIGKVTRKAAREGKVDTAAIQENFEEVAESANMVEEALSTSKTAGYKATAGYEEYQKSLTSLLEKQKLFNEAVANGADATKVYNELGLNRATKDYAVDLGLLFDEINRTNEGFKGLSKNAAETAKEIEKTEREIEATRQNINQGFDFKTFKLFAEQVTNIVTGLGSLATAIQTVNNLGNIWSNESLSTTEKFAQTLMATTTIMMQVQQAYKSLKEAQGIFASMEAALTAITTVNTGATKLNTSEKIKNSSASFGQASGDTSSTVAKKANTIATIQQTAAYKALAAAIKSNPLFWGAAAVIAGVTLLTKALDYLAKAGERAKEAFEESVDAYEEAKSTLSSLSDELDTISDKIDEIEEKGPITLTEATELQNLKAQRAELEAQVAAQEALIKLKQKEVALSAKKDIKAGNYEDALNEGNKTVDSNVKGASGNVQFYNLGTGQYQTLDSYDISAGNLTAKDSDAYEKWREDALAKVKDFEAKRDAAIEEGNTKASKSYQKAIDDMNSYIERYQESWEEAQKNYLATITDGVEDAKTALDALKDTNDGGVNDEEIAYLESYIEEAYRASDQLDTLIAKAYDGVFNTDKLNELIEEVKNLDLDGEGKLTEESLEKLKGIIGEDDLGLLQAWADTTGIALETILERLPIIADSVAKLQEGTSTTNSDTVKSKLDNTTGLLASYKSGDDLDDDQLAYLETLKEEYSNLARIKETDTYEYAKALREIQEIQEDSYRDALRQESELHQEKIKNKTEEYEALMKELEEATESGDEETQLELASNIDDVVAEIQDEMEALEDTEYKIKVSFEDDLASDIQQAFDLADEFDNLQSLISNGLELTTAQALQIVESGNAAILENCAATADGTIMMNQQTVNAYIDGKQTELEADKTSKITQLQSQREILVAQRSALASKLSALQSAAQASDAVTAAEYLNKAQEYESDYQKQVAALNASLENEKEAGDEELTINEQLYNQLGGMYDTDTENEQNADEQAVNTQSKNIEARISNWELAIAAAQAYAQQVAAADDGIVVNAPLSKNTKGGTSSKTTSTPVTKKDLTLNTIDAKDLEQYFTGNKASQEYLDTVNAMISQTESELGSLDDQIGYIDLAIASLNASSTALDKAQSELGKTTGSSSGSNSSDSTKDPETLDLLEEELDLYHDIDLEINKITTSLSRLQKQQEKLVGKDLINNLNKQLEVLEKQVDAYERKMTIAKVEMAGIKGQLSEAGVTFDEEGYISNYASLYAKKLQMVNNAIAEYNTLTAAQQEEQKANIEIIQEEFETFKENIERYDELLNSTIPELQDSITDALDEQIEIEISKFKMEIDIRLNMAEAERDWNKFKKTVIDGIADKDILGDAKANLEDLISYWNTAGTGTGPIQSLTSQLENTLYELKMIDKNGSSTVYGTNKSQALEDLKDYMDELQDQMMDIQDLVDDIQDAYVDMIDDTKDAFDEQIDAYERVTDIIDHNKNVIELLYGDKAYSAMNNFFDAQEQNNNQQLDFLRKEADFWLEKMEAEEKGSDAWKAYKENWEDAIKDLNSLVEDSIENLIDKYTNMIDEIFENLNNKVSNGLGLDYVNDEWDLINKNADEYLDQINAAYSLEQLRVKFQDALNNNDGLAAQKQINALMQEQLGDLETREKLTEYDVERAEKLLDIELKKIALQDAQQNKSKMRLKRDSQGNYSYQFVSDEDKVIEAQKELAEAQNSLYNFDKDRYQENLNEIYSTYNDFQEKLKELYEDTALSDEEREAKKTLLIQQYGELINAKTEQNMQIRLNLEQSAFQELAKMYDTDVANFDAMTQEQKNILMGDLIPYWNSGLQEMVNTFAGEGGFIPVCTESFEQLDEATKDYQTSLDELANTAGYDFEAIYEGQMANLDLTQQMIDKNDELISQYEKEIDAIQEVIDQVTILTAKYNSAKTEAIGASEAAYKYWQEEQAREAAEAAKEAAASATSSSNSNSNSSSSSSSSTNASSGTTAAEANTNKSKEVTVDNVKIGDKLKYIGGYYYYDSYGTSPRGNRGPGKTVTVYNLAPKNKYPISVDSLDSASGWLKPDQLQKLDTGGYTGDWDSSGRLALLHQKELVLNSSDTGNILNAVNIIRGLSDLLGPDTLKNLSTALQAMRVEPLSNAQTGTTETIEQNVHITAEFPNVRDANEAEAAIMNLVNKASQYVGRNNR